MRLDRARDDQAGVRVRLGCLARKIRRKRWASSTAVRRTAARWREPEVWTSRRGSVAARASVTVALGDVAFVDAVDNNLAALIESASELETLEHCDVVVCVSAFGAGGRRGAARGRKRHASPIAGTVRGHRRVVQRGVRAVGPKHGRGMRGGAPRLENARGAGAPAGRRPSSAARNPRSRGGAAVAAAPGADSSATTVDWEVDDRVRHCSAPMIHAPRGSRAQSCSTSVRLAPSAPPYAGLQRVSDAVRPRAAARLPRRRFAGRAPEAAFLAYRGGGRPGRSRANSRRDRGRDRRTSRSLKHTSALVRDPPSRGAPPTREPRCAAIATSPTCAGGGDEHRRRRKGRTTPRDGDLEDAAAIVAADALKDTSESVLAARVRVRRAQTQRHGVAPPRDHDAPCGVDVYWSEADCRGAAVPFGVHDDFADGTAPRNLRCGAVRPCFHP